jgi:hypothetical protein
MKTATPIGRAVSLVGCWIGYQRPVGPGAVCVDDSKGANRS